MTNVSNSQLLLPSGLGCIKLLMQRTLLLSPSGLFLTNTYYDQEIVNNYSGLRTIVPVLLAL